MSTSVMTRNAFARTTAVALRSHRHGSSLNLWRKKRGRQDAPSTSAVTCSICSTLVQVGGSGTQAASWRMLLTASSSADTDLLRGAHNTDVWSSVGLDWGVLRVIESTSRTCASMDRPVRRGCVRMWGVVDCSMMGSEHEHTSFTYTYNTSITWFKFFRFFFGFNFVLQ